MMWWHFEAVVVDDDGDDKPGEQEIDLDVSREDDDEGEQEDLGVVERVVDVGPVRGAAKCQEVETRIIKLQKLFICDSEKQPESPEPELFSHGSVICDIHHRR